VDGGRADGVEGALEVDGDDGVPLGLGHVEDHAVTQDAGHVHQDVDPAPRLHDLLDHRRALREVGHRAVVGLGGASGLLDLGHHLIGRRRFAADAVERGAEVVDDHLGPCRRQRDRDALADPPSRAGHQRGLAVQHAHGSGPPVSICPYRPAVSGSGR
jgi:hypothetical protein